MVAENLESLTDEQLGDKIDEAQTQVQLYCRKDSYICHIYRERLRTYWAEHHRRKK